jgi:hypothetical protein
MTNDLSNFPYLLLSIQTGVLLLKKPFFCLNKIAINMPICPHDLIDLYIQKVANHKSHINRMLVGRGFVSTDKI